MLSTMLKTAGQSPIGQAVVVEQVPESLDDRLSATIAAYDHISAEYACRFASGDLRGHRLRFQERMAPDSPVLDAGCGAGRDCNFLANDGFAAVGLDHSAGLLSQARKLTRAPLVRGDIRSLPFADSFFDGVLRKMGGEDGSNSTHPKASRPWPERAALPSLT